MLNGLIMKNSEFTIHLVEDDPFFGNLVRLRLQENDFSNIELYDSGEACMENIHKSPNVVILDHNLSQMNGMEVLKKIKSANPYIHVIYLSSQEKATVAAESLLFGAYEYLEKSSGSLDRLISLVQRIEHDNNSDK